MTEAAAETQSLLSAGTLFYYFIWPNMVFYFGMRGPRFNPTRPVPYWLCGHRQREVFVEKTNTPYANTVPKYCN